MNFKTNAPYPEPTVIGKNLGYAQILLQEYSGKKSENTVIHLYLYQSFLLQKTYPKISQLLKSIAITEMRHLSLLGQTIALLGMKPIYGVIDQEKIDYWNGDQIDYSTSLQQMLEADIHAEICSIENYQASISSIRDPHIQQLLERIIEDEKVHLQTFQDLYQKSF